MSYLEYEIVKPNVDTERDRRPTKARKRNTGYRDEKSKPHRTLSGKGIIGRLFKWKNIF